MQSRRRYQRFGLLFLLGLAVLVGSLGWLTYREIHQEKLNHALIAAIKRNDTKAALALLAEGVDPNSRDKPPLNLSLWQLVRDRLLGKHTAQSKAPTALLLALQPPPGYIVSTLPEPVRLIILSQICEVNSKALSETKKLRRYLPPEQIPESAPLNSIDISYRPDNPVLIDALLEKGADVHVRDEYGYSPLLLALAEGYPLTSRLLILTGADLNPSSTSGAYSPLMVAIYNSAIGDNLIKEMIDRGAEVNPDRGDGETPLTMAITEQRLSTVRLLLTYHADVNQDVISAARGFATDSDDGRQILQMLKRAGAKP